LKRVGDIRTRNVKAVELVNGSERGVRAAEVKTEQVLIHVLLDRGLDISAASIVVNLYVGDRQPRYAPAFYERKD
jgi:hypothetical protein